MSATTYEKKASIKNGVGRMIFSLLVFMLEVIFIILIFSKLNEYAVWINAVTRVVALLLVLVLYGGNLNSSMKMPWIVLILFAPIVGVGIYLVVGLNSKPYKMRIRYAKINEALKPLLNKEDIKTKSKNAFENLKKTSKGLASISNYIYRNSGYPVYNDSDIKYFQSAKEGLEAQISAMESAQKYIFFEYHAIEDDKAWDKVFQVMKRKASEGVEVRVFYDDMGSIGFITTDFIDRLDAAGIDCRVFNPFAPGLNIFLNNRDHRKITVIDGIIGFTGGYNIANEYFGITHPFGEWKDTGVMIEGEAVKSLTIAFLENWNAAVDKNSKGHQDLDILNTAKESTLEISHEDIDKYLPETSYDKKESGGYIQPYADSPMNDENIGENVYISIINNAKDYCWLITPYLIITDEMIHALGLAAKRGVDVRVVTPGIPDKKIVYSVTRSYYNTLTRNGVHVYEWKPGFCHCKMSVSDDIVATCGTINLDYRSLYHHFENGCVYMDCNAVIDTKKDFEYIFKQSEDVTVKYTGLGGVLKVRQLILRLFAALF
ncbi:MAG: cardiolipin synthase [Pseudobutyrivibrio sp.]|nr:cardiolipin synthase [Pseudobutyrivibrio sp.]